MPNELIANRFYNTTTPIVYTYSYNALSQMLTAANPDAVPTYTYNNVSRQSSVQESYSGNILRYAFDGSGNRTQLKLNKTVHTSYAYDAANRLTTLTDEANQNFTFGYDAADRMTSRTMPNNITTTYNYDGMSRLAELKHQSATTVLADNNFTYNGANQISQIAELAQTRNFGYDAVDRLTQVTNPAATSESYFFDGVGNRTASHLSASYGYQPFNKLVSTATGTYGYDANGNLTSKTDATGSWIYTWDYENRMTSAANGTTTVTYTYDALGRRIKRTQGTSITKFVYDGMDVIRDDANGVITRYQNGLGIDNKLKMIANGGQPSYLLTDHLGSTVGLTNQSGAIISSASYDSFGNSTNTLSTRYQYTGREYDSFTGLMYYRARWYDANLGRFISEDPIGFAGGDVNLFSYVKNKPLNFSDPFGLDEYAMMERLGTRLYPNRVTRPEEVPNLFDDIYGGKNSCHNFGIKTQSKFFPLGDQFGNGDPYNGGYRHCTATCVAIRRYGPFFGHLGRRVGWDLRNEILNAEKDSISDMSAEDIGEEYAVLTNSTSCENLCLITFPGTNSQH